MLPGPQRGRYGEQVGGSLRHQSSGCDRSKDANPSCPVRPTCGPPFKTHLVGPDNNLVGLQAARWRKYGKDRLYVNNSEGVTVGWLDLLTGTRELHQPSLAAAFESAVVQFCTTQALAIPKSDREVAAPSAPVPREDEHSLDTGSPTAPAPTWHDLALNVPGQAVRAQAEAELVAMRDRSRVGTFLARTFDMKTDERAWRVGADGEGKTSAPGWRSCASTDGRCCTPSGR